MGMTNGSVRQILVCRYLLIVRGGMLWGNIIGLALVLVQKWWHVVKLDAEAYMLSEVPVELGWWLVTLNVATIVAPVVWMIIPTMVVSRIKPDVTMRYQ